MPTVYHFTEKKNLTSIFEQGLLTFHNSPCEEWKHLDYYCQSCFVVIDMSDEIMNEMLILMVNKHIWYENQLEEWSQDDWDRWLDSYTCLVFDIPDDIEVHYDPNIHLDYCKKIHQTICSSLITSQLPCKFNWNN